MVKHDTTFKDAKFRKASKSMFMGDNFCVEVAIAGDSVALRDSKDPSAGHHIFSHGEWDAFIDGVKKGEFDL